MKPRKLTAAALEMQGSGTPIRGLQMSTEMAISRPADVRREVDRAKEDPRGAERFRVMSVGQEPGNLDHFTALMIYDIAETELRADRGDEPTQRDLRNLERSEGAVGESISRGNADWFVELMHLSAQAYRRLCGKGAG